MLLALKGHFRKAAVIPALPGSRSSCHWVVFGEEQWKGEELPS